MPQPTAVTTKEGPLPKKHTARAVWSACSRPWRVSLPRQLAPGANPPKSPKSKAGAASCGRRQARHSGCKSLSKKPGQQARHSASTKNGKRAGIKDCKQRLSPSAHPCATRPGKAKNSPPKSKLPKKTVPFCQKRLRFIKITTPGYICTGPKR